MLLEDWVRLPSLLPWFFYSLFQPEMKQGRGGFGSLDKRSDTYKAQGLYLVRVSWTLQRKTGICIHPACGQRATADDYGRMGAMGKALET